MQLKNSNLIAILIVTIFILFNTGMVFADNDCKQVTDTAKTSATQTIKKIKNIFDKSVPSASVYNDELSKCLGGLLQGFNVSIMGNIPNINSIISGLCNKIISKIDLPSFNYDIEIDLGMAKYEVPVDQYSVLLDEAWEEAWTP